GGVAVIAFFTDIDGAVATDDGRAVVTTSVGIVAVGAVIALLCTLQLRVAAGLGHGLAGIAARVVVDGIAVVTLLRILCWASNRLSSAVTTEFDHAGGRAAIARTVVAIVAAFTQASLESAVATEFYPASGGTPVAIVGRSEEHTSELQSRENLVCRLLLEKKN